MIGRLLRIPKKAWMLMTRREPGCSLAKALADVWHGHATPHRNQEMKSRIRQLDSAEPGTLDWETPQGRFRTPEEGGGIHVVLSELEDDVYSTDTDQNGLRRGDVVIDCGAHVGAFTRAALRAGAKHVVALEITPGTRSCLEHNLAAEIEAGQVTVVSKGVWHSAGTLSLAVGNGSLSNTVMEERKQSFQGGFSETIDVEVTTIDNLVEELGLDSVDFIKMDIEGAERHAIAGAKNTLSRFQPRLAIAAYHLHDDREAIRDTVLAAKPTYRERFGRCLLIHDRVAFDALFYS